MYTYFPPPLTRIFRSIDQTCGAELRRSIERLRMTGLPEAPMISIVDDDVSVREATKALVRSLGHKVTTYGSAEEFLGSERISDTCCLITDVQMPGLNGLELQGRLIAEGYRIPVIFMTAFPEESAPEQGTEGRSVRLPQQALQRRQAVRLPGSGPDQWQPNEPKALRHFQIVPPEARSHTIPSYRRSEPNRHQPITLE